MNENYLWDKTGDDAEIEELENALQAFRFQKNEAPRLPAKILPFQAKKSWRSFFKFGLAFAACLLFCIVGVKFWSLHYSGENLTAEIKSSETAAQNPVAQITAPRAENFPAPTVEKIKDFPVKQIKFSRQPLKIKLAKAPKTIPAVKLKNNADDERFAPAETVAKLSREEKFAYDQLLLALSITSSKLKIVKDKIDNSESSKSIQDSEK